MSKESFGERLRYGFDNTMSRGPAALVGWLAGISVVFIAVVSLITTALRIAPVDESGARLGFLQVAWMSLMRTLDAGTMGGDSGGWPFLIAMLVVTIGGIFVISSLIGVLTTGLDQRLEELRKGRSRVIESGHTVILGWSSQVFPIIAELVIANANQRRSCIAILAEKDKVAMEDEIRQMVERTGRTRIVCRTGSSIEMADLERVSLNTAKSIIIMATGEDGSDAQVLKTMLAITNNPRRKAEPYHIVAELHDPENLELVNIVGKDEVEPILVGSLISRVIAQTCRQSGLSAVYTELLDFDGDEIYFQSEPLLTGQTFGQSLLAYEDSAVIGIRSKDGSLLNPCMDRVIQPGDELIVVAEDDDTTRLSAQQAGIQEHLICEGRRSVPQPERTLVLGWNWRAPLVVRELDAYVASGSSVTIVADDVEAEAVLARDCCGLTNQAIKFVAGDTTNRRTLDSLDVHLYSHVVVLSYSDTLDIQAADARTLITLLHLRDIAERTGRRFSIVSEMLDIRNRNLAEVTHADDFIVSDNLVSLMLSQVSENKALNAVFADLFDPEGSEIYMKPVEDFVRLGEPMTFYTVVAAAARRGEVAFGYRLDSLSEDAEKAYGVVINPKKSELVTFAPEDRVIVLAEQ